MINETGIPSATIRAIRKFINTYIDKKTKISPNIRFEIIVFNLSSTGLDVS